MEILAEHQLGDMVARYFRRRGEAGASLMLLPVACRDRIVPKRNLLDGIEIEHFSNRTLPAWRTDSLVHVRLASDDWGGGFTAGLSMRQSQTTQALRWVSSAVTRPDGRTTLIETLLRTEQGLLVVHRLSHRVGQPFLTVWSAVRNGTTADVTLDLLTSFSLGGVTPFHPGAASNRLRLHRFRSFWSAEGRLLSQPLEELQLDRSWAGYTVASERFGQVGSTPVRGWFPVALLEDAQAGVTWGAQVATGASWQIEVYRKDDLVNLSGGLPDREFGRWWKTLRPGESFDAPPAFVTVTAGDADACSQRLVESYRSGREQAPEVDRDLPACFNEWCTTWGFPTHETITRQVRAAADLGIRYVCIDNGWQRGPQVIGKHAVGDWTPAERVFSRGIQAVIAPARESGVVLGLWFEHEVATPGTATWHEHADKMLYLDGQIIQSGGRRFLDMRRPDVHELLERRVIDLLDGNGFGYVKIDYNATLPYGVDGAGSPGEGLRQHVEGVRHFLRRLRERLPNLVIENCSSGGHRLDQSLMSLASVASGSDAHEGYEIPVLAANLHRLLLPEQNLVWATLRRNDTARRIVYSMAATFLGRVCLSGDLTELSEDQTALVREALAFYHRCVPLIRRGVTTWHGPKLGSYRELTGHQIIRRISADGRGALVVAHRFGGNDADLLTLQVGQGWHVERSYHAEPSAPSLDGSVLTFSLPEPFSAAAVLLHREDA